MTKNLNHRLRRTVMHLIIAVLLFNEDFSSGENTETDPPNGVRVPDIFSYPVSALQAYLFTKAGKSVSVAKESRKSVETKLDDFDFTMDFLDRKRESVKNTIDLTTEILQFLQDDLKQRVKKIESNVQLDGKIRLVAFQAFLGDPDLEDLDASTLTFNTSEPIRFSFVRLNEANAYDKTTGVMTAPTEGIYYMATRIKADYRKGAHAFDMYHNDILIARAETSSMRQDQDGIISATMVKMMKGDTVEVRSSFSDTASLYGGTQTWFLGILLNYRRISLQIRPR